MFPVLFLMLFCQVVCTSIAGGMFVKSVSEIHSKHYPNQLRFDVIRCTVLAPHSVCVFYNSTFQMLLLYLASFCSVKLAPWSHMSERNEVSAAIVINNNHFHGIYVIYS